jgi:putative transposase
MTAENRKQRLHRLDQVFLRTPIYFLTTCTQNRRQILARESIHQAFVCFARAGQRQGAWVGAYVLMPDHLHAFVAFDDQNLELSTWMKSLKNTFSKALRLDGIAAPHWQKGFFDHVLRIAESYEQKWHYVRENSVRAGLVKDWMDWPFKERFLICGTTQTSDDSAVIDRRYRKQVTAVKLPRYDRGRCASRRAYGGRLE